MNKFNAFHTLSNHELLPDFDYYYFDEFGRLKGVSEEVALSDMTIPVFYLRNRNTESILALINTPLNGRVPEWIRRINLEKASLTDLNPDAVDSLFSEGVRLTAKTGNRWFSINHRGDIYTNSQGYDAVITSGLIQLQLMDSQTVKAWVPTPDGEATLKDMSVAELHQWQLSDYAPTLKSTSLTEGEISNLKAIGNGWNEPSDHSHLKGLIDKNMVYIFEKIVHLTPTGKKYCALWSEPLEPLKMGEDLEKIEGQTVEIVISSQGFSINSEGALGINSEVAEGYSLGESTGVKSYPTEIKDIVDHSLRHVLHRAEAYDSEGGERSMAKTVAAFNAITGHKLSEVDGWQFMSVLKAVRLFTNRDTVHFDSMEDGISYEALKAESIVKKGLN